MISYSRASPSKKYRELVALYQQMHREGIPRQNVSPEELYLGKSLVGHLPNIRSLVQQTGARSLLDYGSGKGRVYWQRDIRLASGEVIPSIQEYLGVDRIVCYDPAVAEHSVFPAERFDGVISTDALEHCPEQDLPWILEEIFAAARRFVYANVASYPALKFLPNGENAHSTQRPANWWSALIGEVANRHPSVTYRIGIKEAANRRGLLGRLFIRRPRVTMLSNAA
jgi:hypothetical protein